MAASGEQTALGQLGQEATCPLCLDFFEQPMVLSCGHNFCRNCLAQLGTEFSCPQCRAKVDPGSACSNWALANIVSHLKRFQLSEGAHQESSGHQLCQEHGQPLQIFCSSEKSLLCPGCLGGHQGHPLLSLPEAAQEYKDMLDGLLEPLRKEGQKLLEQRQAEEQSRQECQEKFAAEKQKVVAWLAEQEEKMEAEWGVALAQFSREASRLQQLIAQMERKCHQTDGEFLQDIQDTVDRCRSFVVRHTESVSPKLQGRLQTLVEKNASVRQVVDSYKAPAPEKPRSKAPAPENPRSQAPAPEKPRSPKVAWSQLPDTPVRITLDRSTAHPQLWCQKRTVTWGSRYQEWPDMPERFEYQECPDVPERFDQEFCVLGRQGFTTGSHWWEVEVDESADAPVWDAAACWAVGVAKESVRRKGSFQLSPKEGIWAVGQDVEGNNVAFSKVPRKLSWEGSLWKVEVRLDYEAGKVQFLNAKTGMSLHTFRTRPFYGETLRPFFYLAQEEHSIFTH